MYIQKNEEFSGIQELSFDEIKTVNGGGGEVKVSVKPTGGIPPTGGTVTAKKPLGGSGGGKKSSGRDFGKEAEELRKKNDRNSGKSAPTVQ